jgi:hypothetical protein
MTDFLDIIHRLSLIKNFNLFPSSGKAYSDDEDVPVSETSYF